MKKTLYPFLFFLTLLGCENGMKLTFGQKAFSNSPCQTCPKIEITVPEALDVSKLSKTVNGAVREEIISLLSFEDEVELNSIERAIDSFTSDFAKLKEKFQDEVPWEAKIEGELVYEDENMLTLSINSYIFTGGAHGYRSTSFLNFDKIKAEELENWELFEDEEGFMQFVEAKFRVREKIPQDENINATGFMFDNDAFHLSQNIGYTPEGLQLIYNPYEVASYADGPIVMTIPYAEINTFLKRAASL